MRLSVIINTYERTETLRLCLSHLARQAAAQPWEVIVVDDGGSADLSSLERAFEDKLILRMHRIPHHGIASARNAGAGLARGERLWFLGDDVLPDSGCWARHAAERDPQVAVLGPYPLTTPGLSPALRHWIDANRMHLIKNPGNAGYFFFLTGNISIARETFETLQGFDAGYRHYGWEDVDFGLKFELAGGRIRYDAEARAVHVHPRPARAALWQREYWVGYTGRRFYEKWKWLEPEKLEEVRFWPRDLKVKIGPAWRHELGKTLAVFTDTFLPNSQLNARIFERLVYACRLRGFEDGNAPANLEGIQK